MKCQDIAELLPLLIYGEIEEDIAEQMGLHLKTCEACRNQYESLQQTSALLDEWKPAASGLSPAELAAKAIPAKSQTSRWSFKPALVGMAAAIIMFVSLAIIGVDVQQREGSLLISLGRGPIETTPSQLVDFDPQAFETRIREATLLELDRTTFEFAESLTEYLERWDQLQVDQRLELVNLLDLARREDLSRIEEALLSVAANASNDTRITRQALDELAQLIAFGEIQPLRTFETK